MDITKLSKDAFAIVAECPEAKKPYGVTVDPDGSELHFVWSFKIDRSKAKREGFDQKHIRGGIVTDKNFPGCPYCGTKQFYVCGNCNSVVCYHGQKQVTCPSCGQHGEIQMVESIDLRGGGY